MLTFAAGQFLVQMHKQGTRIGQAGKEIRGGRILRQPELKCVLNGERNLGSDCLQNAHVVSGKGIGFSLVERQYPYQPVDAFQRNCKRRTKVYSPFRVICVPRFHHWIAVDDRLYILSHPAAKAFTHRDRQRREDTKVVTAYKFRHQGIALEHKGDKCVMRNKLAKLHRYERQSFVQAQRASQTLAKFKKSLSFLLCGCDRSQKVAVTSRAGGCATLEPSCGTVSTFHFVGHGVCQFLAFSQTA